MLNQENKPEVKENILDDGTVVRVEDARRTVITPDGAIRTFTKPERVAPRREEDKPATE